MKQQKGKMIVIFMVLSALLISGCNTIRQKQSNGRVTLPLFEYRQIDSYYTLKNVEPAGYFAVGLRYVHPPRVEWVPVEGAVSYDLVLLQDDKILGVTPAQDSPTFATEGWDNSKTGKAGIVIIGYGADGKRVALSRMFPFYIVSDYDKKNTVEKERPYDAAAWAVFDCLLSFEYQQYWNIPQDHPARDIQPIILGATTSTKGINNICFPVLHNWMWVDMCESLLKITDDPERISQVKDFLRSAGDHLLMCRLEGEGYLYEGMIKGAVDPMGGPGHNMFNTDPQIIEKHKRLIEPSKNGYAAEALLRVYEILEDQKYLDAALKIAEIFHKTQQQDGSWPARVDGKDGHVLGQYSSSVISVVSFMEKLQQFDDDPKWQTVKTKALQWVKTYPCKTYGWVVNFDDNPALATEVNPYYGLSNVDLCELVKYASEHPDEFEDAYALITEQLNWNDNHLVFYGDDPLLPINPYYPTCGEQGNPGSFISPGGCWLPMDYHTANWAAALLEFYEMSGDDKILEKAAAAANAIMKYQLDDGRTITWMQDKHFGISAQINGATQLSFWQTAWAMSAHVWAQLHAMGCDQ